MNNVEITISRILAMWMFTVVTTLFFVLKHGTGDAGVFRYGPNQNFVVLGICIDTMGKYCIIVTYCFINSALRAINHDILLSWTTTSLMNKHSVIKLNDFQSCEISMVCTIFIWFDYFMNFNILLAQFDMLIVEVSTDLTMTYYVTKYYLGEKKKNINRNNSESSPLLTRM